jgi:fluoride exporter
MAPVDRRELVAIFVGGVLGVMVRAGVVELAPTGDTRWPWGTFTVNVVGAFLLGYFATRLQERLPLSSYRRPLLGTGLCGALTTFSTLQLEVVTMLDRGAFLLAGGYVLASVAAGLAAVHMATALVRRVRVRP